MSVMDNNYHSMNQAQVEQSDLVAILAQRFGFVSDSVQRTIRAVEDLALLDRLIENALEVETWERFVAQLKEGLDELRPA